MTSHGSVSVSNYGSGLPNTGSWIIEGYYRSVRKLRNLLEAK